MPAAPIAPPAVHIIGTLKLIPAVAGIVAPVAYPALSKFKIMPPAVTNAEVYGPAGLVLQTALLKTPDVPK